MKKTLLIFILLYITTNCLAQNKRVVSLEECQELAQKNYPLIKNYNLIDKTAEYTLSNAIKVWLPQVTLSAQASYQSSVAEFPQEILKVYQNMGVDMKGLNKDQYKAAIDIYQNIWDGGYSKAEKRIAKANQVAQTAQNKVDLYAIKDRINNLYFGILLTQEQHKQNILQQELIESNLEKLKKYYKNGIAMQSDLDAIEAELLTIKQQLINITNANNTYTTLLNIFIGEDIDSIITPTEININTININRPEIEYFKKANDKIATQEYAIKSSTAPRIGLSFQGFYGNPGLNLFKDMLHDKFTWNYIAGIKFQWQLGNYYTKKNKLSQIEIAKQMTDVQYSAFMFNTNLQIQEQQKQIQKYKEMMINDNKIIELRTSVRKAYEAKLENGIIDITELLQEITAESAAKLNKHIHYIELLKNIYQLQYIVNN